MSVEQRIKISCDKFECTAAIHSGRGLLEARAAAGESGWVNTLHFVSTERNACLQDFCPDHRDQAFDWQSWNRRETKRLREARSAPHEFVSRSGRNALCHACDLTRGDALHREEARA